MSASTFHCWNVSSEQIGNEREAKNVINTSASWMHLVSNGWTDNPRVVKKRKDIEKKKVLLMAICRNVLHSTEFYKKKPTTTDVHFYFCFIFIHSTILYAHFPCTQGVLKSSTSCLWVKVGSHHREVSPRTHLGGNKVFLHILLILLTE